MYRLVFALIAEMNDSVDESSESSTFDVDSEITNDIEINEFWGPVGEHPSLQHPDLRTGETALDYYQRTTCGPCRRGKYNCSGQDQSRCSACLLGNTKLECTFRRKCFRCPAEESKTQCDGQRPSCSECTSKHLDCGYLDRSDVD